jgi:hypothetical protein
MGVRFPPPAPSKLRAYQLVGFFYVCNALLEVNELCHLTL